MLVNINTIQTMGHFWGLVFNVTVPKTTHQVFSSPCVFVTAVVMLTNSELFG